jgi:hypothetical protein
MFAFAGFIAWLLLLVVIAINNVWASVVFFIISFAALSLYGWYCERDNPPDSPLNVDLEDWNFPDRPTGMVGKF